MSENRPIAHGIWRTPHHLDAHLRAVAALAAEYARRFRGSDWAHLAGLWHDLGKYRPRFQRYIRQASGFEADTHIRGAKPAKHPTPLPAQCWPATRSRLKAESSPI